MANWKYEIGERIVKTDNDGNVVIDCVITDRDIRKSCNDTTRADYMYANTKYFYYEYKCNICGAEHLWKSQKNISTKKCECCANIVRVRGINTIGDLYPDCVQYFSNDDAFDPNLRIADRYNVICPICHHTKNMLIYRLVGAPFRCNHCNSFKVKKPELVQYLVNEDDANLSFASNKKVLVKCPYCGDERLVQVAHLYANGYSCVKCGDGVSFPEKFLFCMLKQLDVTFIKSLSSKQLQWCNQYRYDFYIPDENIIIETHGMQHYAKGFVFNGGRTLEEEQKNDIDKKAVAQQNGIENYVVLDCRYSEPSWMKQSILTSRLNDIYDLSNINWEQCVQFAVGSLAKTICDYWAEHNGVTTGEISQLFKINAVTICKYLKLGTEWGWCHYDAKHELEKSRQKFKTMAKNGKRVAIFKNEECIGVFNSELELSRLSKELFGTRLDIKYISEVCCGRRSLYKGFYFKHVDDNAI